MNERLEAFRKRLRGAEKEKTDWMHLIGSPTAAWIALFLSSSTAFYSFLYHSDVLSVVPMHSSIHLTADNKVHVNSPSVVTLINSGSRPIAVLGVEIFYGQPTSKSANPSCSGPGRFYRFQLTFEQIVVKPYDTVLKQLKFDHADSSEKVHLIPLSDANQTRKDDRVVIACMSFDIVAADTAGWRKILEVERIILDDVGKSSFEYRINIPSAKYVIKRNRFWTEVGEDHAFLFEEELDGTKTEQL